MQELDCVRSVLPSQVFLLTSDCGFRPTKDGCAGSELRVCCTFEVQSKTNLWHHELLYYLCQVQRLACLQ